MAKTIFSIVGIITVIIGMTYYIKGVKSKRIFNNRKRMWLFISSGLLIIAFLIMWIFDQTIIFAALFILNFIISLMLLATKDDSQGGIYRSGKIIVIERTGIGSTNDDVDGGSKDPDNGK